MPYNERLNKVINDSGMTLKEIAAKCNSYGVKITSQYLTQLKNGVNKQASDDVSRAIAQVCGANPEILVIEKYIDLAPESIKRYFDIAKQELVSVFTNTYFTNELDTKQHKELNKYISDTTIADMVVFANSEDYKKISNKNGNLKMDLSDGTDCVHYEYNSAQGFVISDDKMAPKICKGDKVKLEIKENYNNSLVCFVHKSEKTKFICRVCTEIKDGKCYMMSYDNYQPIEYNENSIQILGEVKFIIKNA